MIRKCWTGVKTLLLILCAFLVGASRADELQYSTTWVGNTFGGGPKWVQQSAETLTVLPDGLCVVGSFWDEAGREVGLYRDGQPVARLDHTHMRGGKAAAAAGDYVYYAHTSVREDQPAVGAGEARRDKPICLFGVGRWKKDGSVAPFPGGQTRFKNMAVFREDLDNHDLIPRGLATDGKLLYVADTVAGRIRVLDAISMEPRSDFAVEMPERLALDRTGNLWVIPAGGRRILSFAPDGTPRPVNVPLFEDTIATSLSFSPDDRLIVTDNGPRQQVLFFKLGAASCELAGTFGEPGGMFAEPHPGSVGPKRLAGPVGAGFDSAGNFYVACNVPRGGTVLRSFSPAGALRWELLGLEFLDVADSAPGSDGRVLYTADDQYEFDPAASSGRGWRWTAHTYNPFRSPDDLRFHLPALQCATSVRVLGGRTFLCQRGMWQGVLGFYRQEGSLFVPSAVLSSGPLKAERSNWQPAGQPDHGRFFWRDANGNGRFDPGEYTPTAGPSGEYWASDVDARGDIWQAGRESGLWRWRLRGLDSAGNPDYDPTPARFPMPSPFVDLLRVEYQPASDAMFLTGITPEHPMSGGEWGTVGTEVALYDSWSQKPALRYRVTLPYKKGELWGESFATAGDLFFVVIGKTAEVLVFDQHTGRPLGSMKLGPEVSRESGWVDFRDAIRATRLKNGHYLVFVEEDWKAKVLVYQLVNPRE